MKDLITRFSPPKALQIHKRCLRAGLYNPHDTKIREFICRIYEIVEYLKNFLPFGANQGLPKDEILKLLELSLPRDW